MILGIGVDLVELERIARIHQSYGDSFTGRFCRPGEPQKRIGAALIQHLGGLFAAKEAVLKALGTGWGRGLALRDVEVLRDELGAPAVRLHARAAERAAEMGVEVVHLSISHERGHAIAFALLEGAAAMSPESSGR